jgi:hypothetical protein
MMLTLVRHSSNGKRVAAGILVSIMQSAERLGDRCEPLMDP